MNIILLGAPGSGKGTQSEKLVDKEHFIHFSTGDVMRKEINEGTGLGQEFDSYIKQGKLVPDELVNKLVEKYLQTHHDHLIFDGYPRTVNQAQALDEMLKKVNAQIDKVIYIDVPEQILLDRISGRLICPVCKRSYNLQNRPPKVPGICDYDGAKLVRRPDDAPDKVKVRLAAYQKETMPLVNYYKDKEKVVTVTATDNDPAPVYNEIINILEGKN